MIKTFAINTLAAPPVWGILRRKALRNDPLTILCYHTLGPDQHGVDGWTSLRQSDFRAQLADLRAHYDIVDLDDKRPAKSGKPRAVITFDDGDRGLHRFLLPILKEDPFPVTIYVATAQFETGQPFWFDRVVNALQGPGDIALDELGHWHLPAEDGKGRWRVLGEILEALKKADPDVRDALADQVAEQGTPVTDGFGPMTLDQLKEIAAFPNVTIGAHSHGHEILDQIPLKAASDSIARSRTLLLQWTGQAIGHFAFPNGNHSTNLRAAIKEMGFTTAAILEDRTAPHDADPFALPRISIGRYDSRSRFRLRLAGL